MNLDQREPPQIIAELLVRECIRDDQPRFAVIIDDPDAETYGIKSTSYVDADRAGWSGNVSRNLASGLTQSQATGVVTLLNEAKARVKEQFAQR